MTSSARIPILDPALSIIVSKKLHLDRVSNELRKELSVELCNHHEALLPPGHFQKGSLVFERLLNLSPFFPETIHFPKKAGRSMKVLYGICTFSNFEE